MPDVFINYRTGDGDEAAALVERALSERFGKERIFRAAKSIPPGDPFGDTLLNAVRHSAALLAIMGPDWIRDPRLRDENDWVRREILEAYAHGVRVIPVLKGRKADRLNAMDLPPELARLALVQSLRLDMRDNGTDLKRIGDELSDLVPTLKEADRESQAKDPDEVRNSATDIRGTVAQGRDITGDIGTVIKGNRGPVHTGKGNIYQDSQHFSWRQLDDPRGDEDKR